MKVNIFDGSITAQWPKIGLPVIINRRINFLFTV